MRRRCGRNPEHAGYLIGRANARYMLHDYDGALADYIEGDPLAPVVRSRLGRPRQRLYVRRDYIRAIADYDEVIRLSSEDANAYYGRGAARIGQRDWEGALIDFNRSIAINPRVAIVLAAARASMSGPAIATGPRPTFGKPSASRKATPRR